MAAAVADYRPRSAATEKIKKGKAGLTLELECTTDILGSVKGNFIKVGFAAESSNLLINAKQKLRQKDLDLIVANDITASDSGFGADMNQVTIIDRTGKIDSLPLLPKREVADKVLDRVVEFLEGIVVYCSLRKESRLGFNKKQEHLFPKLKKTLTFETAIGNIQVSYNPKYAEFGPRGVSKWLKWLNNTHPELKAGGRVQLQVIESKSGRRYVLNPLQ
jgi:hypothetical protein